MLTGDPTVDGVQNIKWLKIDKIIEDRLSVKSQRIATLAAEIQSLEARIAEKKAGEEAKAMPVVDVTKLITDSLSAFGSAATAAETKCGKPRSDPRAPRGAYKGSKEAFKAAATEYFKDKIRCDGDEFLAECGRLLPPGGGPEESYCAPLCQYFKDIVQDLSDAVAGETAGKGSDELVKELKEKMEESAATKTAVSTCERARDFITGFSKQITQQKQAIEGRFGEYQVAEENLEDASWNLEDLKGLLDTEQLALAAAETALEKSGADVAAAEQSLKALQAEEASLLGELSELSSLMEATKSKLNAAKEADKVVIQLKGAVSATTMKMRILFQKQVLEPLDDVGLGSSTNMKEYTEPDIDELDAADNLREQLESLAGYCKGDAMKAFAAVKHRVNLDGLCDFDEPSAVFSELSSTVHKRREVIGSKIEELQSWMDPLKGQQGMTPARVEEFVKLGEPEGLRAVVAVFSGTEVFKNYLKEWQLKGKFLRLLAQLRDVVDSTDASFTSLGTDLETLKSKIDSVVAKRAQAEKDLAAALSKEGIDAESKAALEETVKTMTANAQELGDDKRRLEEEVRKAKERWDASKDALVKAHEEGTSFLESWADGQAVNLLDAAVLQAKQELSRTKNELKDAEASFTAVETKIAVAQRGW